ncbi:hypothetical protein Scep_021390 [Stephania cephalantha]|uniref:CASP-like protein n=1 Tax=Stephania cephalantha TaxID=152367 RepID=A0AAP0F4I5_9MAGN
MKKLFGGPGTVVGLVLRIGQCLFASASIGAMVSAFWASLGTLLSVTCIIFFSYLIASTGLQVLWSFGLAWLDVYALRIKRNLQNHVLVSLFVVGDWYLIQFGSCVDIKMQVTATPSLAGAISSAGVIILYAKDLWHVRFTVLGWINLIGLDKTTYPDDEDTLTQEDDDEDAEDEHRCSPELETAQGEREVKNEIEFQNLLEM